ncbi:MAG: GDSL-type esterase/lipase family protein [Solirubrobacterales bacterium]
MNPRVHFYGDSFVAGFGDPLGAGWVGRISARCAEAGSPIEVANHGVPGETSAQAVARFFNTRIDPPELRDRPEMVVLSFGTNDVITQTTAEQSLASLGSAIDLAGQLSLPAFVVGPPPVGDLPDADAKLIELSNEFAAICAARDVPFIETHGPLASGGAWSEEAAAGDGSHPQGGGYDQLAQLLHEAGLVAWLTKSSR